MPRKILFVTHDATRTGAPILLLHLVKWAWQNKGCKPWSSLTKERLGLHLQGKDVIHLPRIHPGKSYQGLRSSGCSPTRTCEPAWALRPALEHDIDRVGARILHYIL